MEPTTAGTDDDPITSPPPAATAPPSSSAAEYEHSRTIPLANLTPDEAANGALVKVVVALLFPYSPATQTLRLVLAEADSRLRSNKGQLRVSFHGPAARELAKRDVQIGDVVVLSLEGARFHKLRNATGREVPWSVRFENRLVVRVREEDVAVDEEAEDAGGAAGLNVPNEEAGGGRGASPATSEGSQSEWKIPAGKRRGLTQHLPEGENYFGNLFDDEEQLLREMERAEQSEKEGPAKKRPRFSRGSYTLIKDEEDFTSTEPNRSTGSAIGDGSQSPKVENEDLVELMATDNHPVVPHILVSEEDRMDETPDSQTEMPPPPLPAIKDEDKDHEEQEQEIPDSPNLKPVDSSMLPLISPIENHGLSFSDYMMAEQQRAPPLLSLDNVKAEPVEHLIPDARSGGLVPLLPEPAGITISRPESERGAREDSTGPNSLFDVSPSPDGDNGGRSPVSMSVSMQPSPLRNVETVEGYPARGGGMHEEEGVRKTPLLLPIVATPRVRSGEKRGVGVEAAGLDGENAKGEDVAHEDVDDSQEGGDHQSGDSEGKDITLSVNHNASENLHDDGKQTLLTPRSPIQSPDSDSNTPPAPSTASNNFQSGITTPHSDFPPLSHLSWGATQDFIGVVCRAKPIERAKRGQRDYYTSMRVVDSSLPLGITVSVFRPYRAAVPRVEVGDCVLLRNFKIVSQERNLVAVSTDTSAYAVWKDYGRDRDAVVVGPPVEWGGEEEGYVRGVGEWFKGLGEEVKSDLGRWEESGVRRRRRAEEEGGGEGKGKDEGGGKGKGKEEGKGKGKGQD